MSDIIISTAYSSRQLMKSTGIENRMVLKNTLLYLWMVNFVKSVINKTISIELYCLLLSRFAILNE